MEGKEKKPIVAVAGATGAQGSSVVRYLLKEGKWHVRGLTRNPDSDRSRELKDMEVEMVRGDQHKPEEIEQALEGVYAFFAVTNFWDPTSMGKEAEIGKMLVDKAKKMGVKHFLWSSLPHVNKLSGGKWHVPHFTDKAVVEEYARDSGMRCTFIGPAFYYQNFKSFFPPKKDDQGRFVFTLPMPETAYLTAFDVDDIGLGVITALNDPETWEGKYMPLVGEHAHPQDYMKTFAEVTGQKAVLNSVSVERFAAFDIPGAAELAQMFGWFNEHTYFGPDVDITLSKKAAPGLKSWREWLQSSGWKGET